MSRLLTSRSFGSLSVHPPLAEDGQTIGLLGGSFNPPHDGHRMLSNYVLKRAQLDQLWWVVSPGNPLKSKDELAALSKRTSQAQELITNPKIKITAFEASLPTAYSAQTLAFLKQRYQTLNFVWIMGADNLQTFHQWQNWEAIFQTMPIIVVDRPSYHLKALNSKAARRFAPFRIPDTQLPLIARCKAPVWAYTTMPLSYLSSTQLRACLKGQ